MNRIRTMLCAFGVYLILKNSEESLGIWVHENQDLKIFGNGNEYLDIKLLDLLNKNIKERYGWEDVNEMK